MSQQPYQNQTKPLPVKVDIRTGIRQASACLRNGTIQVSVPKYWPKQNKDSAIETLVEKIQKQHHKDLNILHQYVEADLITITNKTDLHDYVTQINQNTFNVPLKATRIGTAKYSRLAQMNIQSKTMTVSKYCLTQVPESALQYLILHELAHLIEANHSKRFWALVAQYMPDYKHQSKVIKAFHQIRCLEADQTTTTQNKTKPTPQPVDTNHPWFEDFKQLFLIKPVKQNH